jgi:hypothetical protein
MFLSFIALRRMLIILGCLACWCPCIVYGTNKHRYEFLTFYGTPDPRRGGGCCSCDCCFYACLIYFGCWWVLQVCIANEPLFLCISSTTMDFRWVNALACAPDTRSTDRALRIAWLLSGAPVANLLKKNANWDWRNSSLGL